MTPRRTRVLSIVGPGRSGTTILGNILGEVQGIVNAGEIRWLWQRGLLERRPCGCGLPPSECPRWSVVLDRWWEAWRPGTAEEDRPQQIQQVLRAQREVLSRRNQPRVIPSANGRETSWEALRITRTAIAALCGSLAAVTGARLVVETSKHPSVAALLAGAGQLDHVVLHVVRDPRAVAFSWRRPKPLRLATGIGTMATMGTRSSVGSWIENCLGVEVLRRHVPPQRWLFLRYEDFVADPRGHVDVVLDFLDVDGGAPFVGDEAVELGVNHTLAGNPNRFRTGVVRIAEDDEWRARLPRRDRRIITAAALPFLRRYGYPIRTAASATRPRGHRQQ